MEQLAADAVLLAGPTLLVPLAVMVQSHSLEGKYYQQQTKTILRKYPGVTSHTLGLPPDQGPGADRAVFR